MKLLTTILLVVLMIGVTPAFAADSSADQQTVTSTAVKETNSDIGDGLLVTDQSDDGQVDPLDETSGYMDEYDDNGDYVGDYVVVDSSDESDISGEDGDYSDESDEGSYDQVSDESDDIGDYIVVDSPDMSDQPDDNGDYIDLSTDEQSDDNGDFTAVEIDDEFELGDIDQLDESFEGSTDELDEGDYTVIDSNDQSETISQIDTNISIDTGKPLLVTLINELCGVVQCTLEGVDTICAVLGNELGMIL
jgi:hypothetical protein